MPASKKGPGRPRDAGLAERRRREILGAAAHAFAERGFDAAQTDDIAAAAGVSKGTVFRYFPTKERLFLAAVDDAMRRLLDATDAAAAHVEDPLEQVTEAVRAYLAFFDANPETVELLVLERAVFKDRRKPTYFEYRDANVGRWQELFRRLSADGRVRDVPAERITDVISATMYGTIFTNHFAGRRTSLERQAADTIDVVFNGILAAPTRGRRR